MKLKSKKNPKESIIVQSSGRNIIISKGFVIVDSDENKNKTTLRPDILETNYIIPDNVYLK